MKKALSVLLSVLLLFGAFAYTAAAEETDNDVWSGTYGDNITWTLKDGVLTVSGTGAIEPQIRDRIETSYYWDSEEHLWEMETIEYVNDVYYPWDNDTLANWAFGYDCWNDGINAIIYGELDYETFFSAYDAVHTIVIGEGITEIYCNAFDAYLPRTIVLPSTLTTITDEWNKGVVVYSFYAGFNTSLTEDIYFKNAETDFNNIKMRLMGYAGDAPGEKPYTMWFPFSSDDMDLYTKMIRVSEAEAPLMALYNLQTGSFNAERWSGEYDGTIDEDFIPAFLEGYAEIYCRRMNETLGTDYIPGSDAFIEKTISLVNENLGSSFSSLDEIFVLKAAEEEGGLPTAERSEAFSSLFEPITTYFQELAQSYDNNFLYLDFLHLGKEPTLIINGEQTELHAEPWLTVHGPLGSTTEAAAAVTGVNFVPMCPTEYAHSVVGKEEVTPTCTAAGHTAGWYCEDCNIWLDGEEIMPLGHRNAYEVAATLPTAVVHGHEAGVYCPDCDTWLSGHEVIHNQLGVREVIKEPTVDEEGEVYIVCTVCGETGLYALEKLDPPETPDEPEQQEGGSMNIIERIKAFAKSVVDWLLRLIRWIGKR